jgi:hypothetical protein
MSMFGRFGGGCLCRQLHQAPRGKRRPVERLADLFHNIFRHADFTSSDVAVTLYLAAMLQRLDRRERIRELLDPASGAYHKRHVYFDHLLLPLHFINVTIILQPPDLLSLLRMLLSNSICLCADLLGTWLHKLEPIKCTSSAFCQPQCSLIFIGLVCRR